MESSGSPQDLSSHQTIPNERVLVLADTSRNFGSARKLCKSTNTIVSDCPGQNTASTSSKQSKDSVDITLIASKWKKELDKWYEEDPENMKSSVFLGKPLAIEVKKATTEGTKFFTLTGDTFSFKLNIGPNTTVGKTDLTKVRFNAIVHRYLYEAAQRESDPESKGFKSSALVGRVEFEQGDPLFKYRFLLGEGFYMSHDLFMGEEEQNLFLLGCILLDFLSCHSSKSPRYDSCKNIKTFVQYVGSSAAKHGETLLAALRHSGISWSLLNQKLPLLETKAQLLIVHPYGTSIYSIIIRKKFKAFRREIANSEDHLAVG